MVEAKRKKYGLLKDLVVTGESCPADSLAEISFFTNIEKIRFSQSTYEKVNS